jgi:hypothetical protein
MFVELILEEDNENDKETEETEDNKETRLEFDFDDLSNELHTTMNKLFGNNSKETNNNIMKATKSFMIMLDPTGKRIKSILDKMNKS